MRERLDDLLHDLRTCCLDKNVSFKLIRRKYCADIEMIFFCHLLDQTGDSPLLVCCGLYDVDCRKFVHLNQLGITVINRYIMNPTNPIKRMPAPATFAITVNSSRVGFLVNLSTLR